MDLKIGRKCVSLGPWGLRLWGLVGLSDARLCLLGTLVPTL